MKKIQLSKYKKSPKYPGLYAIVDDDDFEFLNSFLWTATKIQNTFYAMRSTQRDKNGKQKIIYMHNVIMGRKWIDHADRNGLNNQKSNLRRCNPLLNSHNRKPKTGKFGYIGVSACGGKFRARIKIGAVAIHIGTFASAKEAAIAYNNAAKKLRGEFAYLNKICED